MNRTIATLAAATALILAPVAAQADEPAVEPTATVATVEPENVGPGEMEPVIQIRRSPQSSKGDPFQRIDALKKSEQGKAKYKPRQPNPKPTPVAPSATAPAPAPYPGVREPSVSRPAQPNPESHRAVAGQWVTVSA